MSKKDIMRAVVAKLAEQDVKTTMAHVDQVFDALVSVIRDEIAKDDFKELALPGLGKFKASTRAARNGRNPQTGEAIQIPAKNVVTFKISSAVKDSVAQ